MRRLIIANQKGGVGKTTTALNVGAGLAGNGKRVLLIDIDPQANLTTGLLGNVEPGQTVYDLLLSEETTPDQVIIPADAAGVDIIPSSIDLAGAEVELISAIGGQAMLRTKLAASRLDYDFLLIDPPPSLGLLTINALAASEEVIIPVSASFFGLRGIVRLEKTIENVHTRLDTPALRITGVLATMTDNTRVSSDVMEAIRSRFGDIAFKTSIPRNVRVEEAHSQTMPIFAHAPESKGAHAYTALVKEILQRG